jgi:hypothetical protein
MPTTEKLMFRPVEAAEAIGHWEEHKETENE